MNRAIERLIKDIAESEPIQRELLALGWTQPELESLFPKVSKEHSVSHDLSGPESRRLYGWRMSRESWPSSAGWVIEDSNGAIIAQAGVFLGTGTNNEAEYSAAILGSKTHTSAGLERFVYVLTVS